MKKETILKAIDSLPENIDLNDLFEKLIIQEKIEKGLESIEKGETVSHEKVEEYSKNKWRK
jgi:predicted transcriptional regulator